MLGPTSAEIHRRRIDDPDPLRQPAVLQAGVLAGCNDAVSFLHACTSFDARKGDRVGTACCYSVHLVHFHPHEALRSAARMFGSNRPVRSSGRQDVRNLVQSRRVCSRSGDDQTFMASAPMTAAVPRHTRGRPSERERRGGAEVDNVQCHAVTIMGMRMTYSDDPSGSHESGIASGSSQALTGPSPLLATTVSVMNSLSAPRYAAGAAEAR